MNKAKSGSLLDQAIADAKSVQKIALENAKDMLMETFAPQIQSMLSQKIRQEVEGDNTEETQDTEETPTEPDVETPPATDDIDIDGESTPTAETPEAPAAEKKPAPPADDEPVTEPEETGSGTDENPDEEVEINITDEDINDLTGGEESTEEVPSSVSDEDKDIDEIIKELEGESEGGEEDDIVNEPTASTDEDVDINIDSEDDGEDEVPGLGEEKTEDPQGPGFKAEKIWEDEGNDEEVDIDEILRELEGEDEEIPVEEKPADATVAEVKKLKAANKDLNDKLTEARKIVKLFKGKLNEVTLLNSKLLYANRLFRKYDLNEEQKLKVIDKFDLANTLHEVKLVYVSIHESLNVTKPAAKKPSKQVRNITESIASSIRGTTKPEKKIIAENTSELVQRFKTLANIK